MLGQEGAAGAPAKEKTDHLRNLAVWLPLVPVVLLILSCSGQVSVSAIRSRSSQGIQYGLNELYNGTGIRSFVGCTYRYVLIVAPPGCGDQVQVDGIEVLP
jgi:hypothetical protein